jgi:D-alanyl-lipoteichoic acid acyltransferase DltB (MBOAT superfamily)
MTFNSIRFAFFFVIVYAVYLLLMKRLRWQNVMLLLASFVFYGWWDWRFLFLLWLSILIDYFCAMWIEDSEDPKRRKMIIATSVASQLTLLGFFKYYNFFTYNLQSALDSFGLHVPLYHLNVILPVGISFYTFQTMSYSLDVYYRRIRASRSLIDFALYVSFFPHLVAGPIQRTDLLTQLKKERVITRDNIVQGIHFCFWGFFLKIFVADNLAHMVDPIFQSAPPYKGSDVLLATYAFAFQVYGDFAGYSLVALGCAKMMGVHLMFNFKRPYFSKNISEFWRRWHISLSSWFRDYMFSPYYMSIDKSPKYRNLSYKARHNLIFFISLMVTELLLGFWHGANWNFGLFGLYHALLIWLYYAFRKHWDRLPGALQIILTFQLVCYGWLIFRVRSIPQLWHMTSALFFNFQIPASTVLESTIVQMIAFTFIVVLIEIYEARNDEMLAIVKWPVPARLFLYVTFFCLMAIWGNFEERQFIYFQF